jgi:hypothetical protein
MGRVTPKAHNCGIGFKALAEPIEPEAVEKFLKEKAALQQEIQQLQTQLQERKAERGAVAHHLPLGQVPEAERFDRLSSGSKYLVDTIKLMAYRAETVMAEIVREALLKGRHGEERRLLQSVYASEADLIPDQWAGTLTVRVHYWANDMLRLRRTDGYGDGVSHHQAAAGLYLGWGRIIGQGAGRSRRGFLENAEIQ